MPQTPQEAPEQEAQRRLRVAIIGSGPAGVYAADLLTRSEEARDGRARLSIDLFDRYPAPFGLIRYGVAPDHPRIKGIVKSLHQIMENPDLRFFGNVEYGTDLTLAALRQHYDAIIFATGAVDDAALHIPGIDLDGSYGAADFVAWYDGHPDVPREWPLRAREIAVLGNGNVALDVARVLSKHADDLLSTEIPDNVYQGLKASPVTDVHVFGRRGPAQMKFTPLELRELAKTRDVEIVLYEEDLQYDDASRAGIESNNQIKALIKTLEKWREAQRERTEHASRRLHLHFLESPAEVVGDEDGKVRAIRMQRNELDGAGGIRPTGEIREYPVQAVYRAIGYFGSELPDVGFDRSRGVITNVEGRVVDERGEPVPGLYATGWIKRGPVGLIGSTKSDALETITHLLDDRAYTAEAPEEGAVVDLLESQGVEYTTWEGWRALDAHEQRLGAERTDAAGNPRQRVKVVPREEMVRICRDR